jgi:hypothetical protein
MKKPGQSSPSSRASVRSSESPGIGPRGRIPSVRVSYDARCRKNNAVLRSCKRAHMCFRTGISFSAVYLSAGSAAAARGCRFPPGRDLRLLKPVLFPVLRWSSSDEPFPRPCRSSPNTTKLPPALDFGNRTPEKAKEIWGTCAQPPPDRICRFAARITSSPTPPTIRSNGMICR